MKEVLFSPPILGPSLPSFLSSAFHLCIHGSCSKYLRLLLATCAGQSPVLFLVTSHVLLTPALASPVLASPLTLSPPHWLNFLSLSVLFLISSRSAESNWFPLLPSYIYPSSFLISQTLYHGLGGHNPISCHGQPSFSLTPLVLLAVLESTKHIPGSNIS